MSLALAHAYYKIRGLKLKAITAENSLRELDFDEIVWKRNSLEGDIDRMTLEKRELEICIEKYHSELRQRDRKLNEFDHKEAVLKERAKLEAKESYKLSKELENSKLEITKLVNNLNTLKAKSESIKDSLHEIDYVNNPSLFTEDDAKR